MGKMKQLWSTWLLAVALTVSTNAQISQTAEHWNMPTVSANASSMDVISGFYYGWMDLNGDGFPDLIDTQDNTNTSSPWEKDGEYVWKIYMNTGTAINSVAEEWVVPDIANDPANMNVVSGYTYGWLDLNGDGLPDLVDPRDNENTFDPWIDGRPYLKVYYNTGSSLNTTAAIWDMPQLTKNVEDANVLSAFYWGWYDMNNDGYIDLVDSQDNDGDGAWLTADDKPYWKVYLNDGTKLDTVNYIEWIIPEVADDINNMDAITASTYSLFDINGDGYPDMVDAQQNGTNDVWEENGQRYWKVYLNDGSKFATEAIHWALPNVTSSAANMDVVYASSYSWLDINGDGIPDFIDAQENGTNNVWTDGERRYWKVYLNDEQALSTEAVEYDIPNVVTNASSMDLVFGSTFSWMDINGDGTVDLIDCQDNSSNAVWEENDQRYWKVYLNTAENLPTYTNNDLPISEISVYPNPTAGIIQVQLYDDAKATISIYNGTGTQVYKTKEPVLQSFSYNLSHLPDGFYFVKVNCNNTETITKVVKQ